MGKKFDHKVVEKSIYDMWEKGGYFKGKIVEGKKPFTILLPPPNASGKMHTGNVLMIAIEDLLIRYHRMKGDPTLWVPGTDHAGFETQITFERELAKKGKSRFDYPRTKLYEMIWEFVQGNKSDIEAQIKAMGASVDWDRYTFTLDDHVVDTVHDTFVKMYEEGLIYRDNYLVNYCPVCGTTFADLEVLHKSRNDPLYYVRYRLVERKEGEPEYLVVATVRPEPIMIDTHLAINPKDKKNAKWIGRQVENPLTGVEMQVIASESADPEFGTGIVKLTPGHDKDDWEVAQREGIPVVSVINLDGRMSDLAGEYAGLKVKKAREAVVERLDKEGLLENVNTKYEHSVAVCYKGGHDIEPMVLPNWFVKVDPLKKPAHKAVIDGEVKIYPEWREKTYLRWMEEMRDWPISRQVVWGIRIPVWYKVEDNPELIVSSLVDGEVVSGRVDELVEKHGFEKIAEGLQSLIAPTGVKPEISKEDPGHGYLPETDTFDTWFSSGQWPLVTLGYPDHADYKYFYPTSVLETGWEIVRLWVSRMVMFGIYLTGRVPFTRVYLHGLVRAMDGRKMSKSLGNVVNPEEYMEQYGVDALRMGLISGTANGKDFRFPHDKVIAYRNFANKLWNMTRFMNIMIEQNGGEGHVYDGSEKLTGEDKAVVEGVTKLAKSVNKQIEQFKFAQAAEEIYHFMWGEVADKYIEQVKDREDKGLGIGVLRYVMREGFKLLHPFMPFITEELWGQVKNEGEAAIIVSPYPQGK